MRIADSQATEPESIAEQSLQSVIDELTQERALESLVALEGSTEAAMAVWTECCDQAGVPSRPETLDQLSKVAEELVAQGGAVSLIGSSLAIRVNTYRLLEQTRRLEAFLKEDTAS